MQAQRSTGVVKKIDPRDTYNRLGIETPGQKRWTWLSYFGNLQPRTLGATITYDVLIDSKDRPYIAEYNVLEGGTADNPPLNRSTPDARPQGVPQQASAPAAPPPPRNPTPRGLPPPLSTDALLEFVAQVGLKYAELGEADSLDQCFEKAAELAMRLDTKLTAYRRNGLVGPPPKPAAPRPNNPAAIAEAMANRARGVPQEEEPPPPLEHEPTVDEFDDDIPF